MPFRIHHLFATALLSLAPIAPASADQLLIATGSDLFNCNVLGWSFSNPQALPIPCAAIAREYTDDGVIYRFIFSDRSEFALFTPLRGETNGGHIQRGVSRFAAIKGGQPIFLEGEGWCREQLSGWYGVWCEHTVGRDRYYLWGAWSGQIQRNVN